MADERTAYKDTSSEEAPIEKSKMTGNSCDSRSFFNGMCYIELSLIDIHTAFFGCT